MRKLLLLLLSTSAIGFGLTSPAEATQITAFGQTSGSNTVDATVNAADTVTTISITDALVNLTQLLVPGPMTGLDFDMTATSIDAVTMVGATGLLQHYNGTFCIATGPGCTGTDVLSGSFTDAAFGAGGGPGLVVNVNNPPDTLSLSSAIIPASDLIAPNAFSVGFSNLTPGLGTIGTTIAPFTASFAGTVSASVRAIPEPSSIGFAFVSLALAGLLWFRRRFR